MTVMLNMKMFIAMVMRSSRGRNVKTQGDCF